MPAIAPPLPSPVRGVWRPRPLGAEECEECEECELWSPGRVRTAPPQLGRRRYTGLKTEAPG